LSLGDVHIVQLDNIRSRQTGKDLVRITIVSVSYMPQQQHLFNGPLSVTTWVSWYQEGKTSLDLLKQETMSGSDISWAICKSAPRPRQITMPAPHQW